MKAEEVNPVVLLPFTQGKFPAGTFFRFYGNIYVVASWNPDDTATVLSFGDGSVADIHTFALDLSDSSYEIVCPILLTYEVVR